MVRLSAADVVIGVSQPQSPNVVAQWLTAKKPSVHSYRG
jgi:hypothetical protein